jgi:hypothetical protein
MATPERESTEPTARTRASLPDPGAPSREAPGSPQAERPPAEKPTRPRRNYALAITIALVVFALLIGMRVLWGGLGSRQSAPSLPQAETTQGAPVQSN